MTPKKIGRPTSEPKKHQVMVRLDEETNTIVEEYQEQEKITKAEAMRIGARKLKEDIKKTP